MFNENRLNFSFFTNKLFWIICKRFWFFHAHFFFKFYSIHANFFQLSFNFINISILVLQKISILLKFWAIETVEQFFQQLYKSKFFKFLRKIFLQNKQLFSRSMNRNLKKVYYNSDFSRFRDDFQNKLFSNKITFY